MFPKIRQENWLDITQSSRIWENCQDLAKFYEIFPCWAGIDLVGLNAPKVDLI